MGKCHKVDIYKKQQLKKGRKNRKKAPYFEATVRLELQAIDVLSKHLTLDA